MTVLKIHSVKNTRVCLSDSFYIQSMINFSQSEQLYQKKRWFVAPGFIDLSDHFLEFFWPIRSFDKPIGRERPSERLKRIIQI